MIEGSGCAGAHEFLDAHFDNLVTAVVLEVGNAVAGHVCLRML
jgi:CheY-specific phosphatase CheX